MRADQVGAAGNHVKRLIIERVKRRHLENVEEMIVQVQCPDGCCHDELEIAISAPVRAALLAVVDREIAEAVGALTALGVTGLDDLGAEDPHAADEDADGDDDDLEDAA